MNSFSETMGQLLPMSMMICIVQVGVLALIGLLGTRTFMRRKPSLALSLAQPVVVVIAALSILLLLPSSLRIPVGDWTEADTITASESEVVSAQSSASQDDTSTPVASGERAKLSFSVAFGFVEKKLGQLSKRPILANNTWWPVAVCLMLSVIVFSAIRFLVAVFCTVRVVRASHDVDDTPTIELLRDFGTNFRSADTIRLVESDHIGSAAVFGWPFSTILLPSDWRDWSEVQLRSALAHELAHADRRDFLWRIVNSLVAVVHAYNPLVHLLVRRIVLAQEIHADMTAAKVVGPKVYLHALSSLALQRDGREEVSEAGLCPVFSGYLIRRISMLNENKDWDFRGPRSATKWMCAVTVASMGFVLFAVGSIAQPPAVGQSESKNVAASPAVTSTDSDPTAAMFRRPRLRVPETVGEGTGFVKVRISDFRVLLIDGPLNKEVSQAAAMELQQRMELDAVPDIDFSVAEVGYGSAFANFSYHPDQPDGHKNRLSFGINEFHVETNKPVNVDSWFARFVPQAQKTVRGGRDFFMLPVLKELGPYGVAVANGGPQAVDFAMRDLPEPQATAAAIARSGVKVVRISHTETSDRSAWVRAFERIDGGLFSFVTTIVDFPVPDKLALDDDLTEQERLASECMDRIARNVRTVGIGFDVAENGTEIGLRLRVTGADHAAAEKLAVDIKEVARMERIRISSDETEEEDLIAAALILELMDRSVMAIVDNDDGTSDVCVNTAANVQIPQIRQFLLWL